MNKPYKDGDSMCYIVQIIVFAVSVEELESIQGPRKTGRLKNFRWFGGYHDIAGCNLLKRFFQLLQNICVFWAARTVRTKHETTTIALMKSRWRDLSCLFQPTGNIYVRFSSIMYSYVLADANREDTFYAVAFNRNNNSVIISSRFASLDTTSKTWTAWTSWIFLAYVVSFYLLRRISLRSLCDGRQSF